MCLKIRPMQGRTLVSDENEAKEQEQGEIPNFYDRLL